MKDLFQYGNRREEEWEILPWIPDPRPPFKIWVKPDQIAPFFLIPHHPYAISLLLKISDGFQVEEFCRLGRTGSSKDWERLVRGVPTGAACQKAPEQETGPEKDRFQGTGRK